MGSAFLLCTGKDHTMVVVTRKAAVKICRVKEYIVLLVFPSSKSNFSVSSEQ